MVARNHCVVVGRTEVSRVRKSTKRGQLSDPILDNQLNEEASRKIPVRRFNDAGELMFEPTFRRTAGGRLSKSIPSMAGIGTLIFISGLLEVIPAVQHDTRLSTGRGGDSSDEEEQS